MKILTVVGTRPNFIKITRFPFVLKNYPDIEYRLCHTGQHFDSNMSDIFFKELKIPEPDYYLGIKPSSVINQFVEIGSNTLVYFEMERIIQLVDDIIAGNYKKGAVPELWDGKATERIVDILVD